MGNPQEIEKMFEWIESNKELGKVDICINNAACVWAKGLMDMSLEEMQTMLNVNVLAYNYATKLSVQSMLKNSVDDGQIIFINSIFGHWVLPNPSMSFYTATKQAIGSLLDGWRLELSSLGKNIRIGQVSPGFIKTEAVETAFGREASEAIYGSTPHLTCEDVAAGILQILKAKTHVLTQDVILRHVHEDPAILTGGIGGVGEGNSNK